MKRSVPETTPDFEELERREWLDSLDYVIARRYVYDQQHRCDWRRGLYSDHQFSGSRYSRHARAKKEPVFRDEQIQPRLNLPLALSFDHRVIDGAEAARFLRWVAEALEQPFKLTIEG